MELLNYHRSGTPYWTRLHLLPLFDESGELSHFAALQQDITARHIRSEALYRMVVSDEVAAACSTARCSSMSAPRACSWRSARASR